MDDTQDWQFGIHLRTKMARRSVPVEWLLETLDKPDQVKASGHRKVYQKRFGDMLLRAVVGGRLVITAYLTSRIEKSLRRGKLAW
jgi:hypothetical protein